MAATQWDLSLSDERQPQTVAPSSTDARQAGSRRKRWPLKYQLALQIVLTILVFVVVAVFTGLTMRTRLIEARQSDVRNDVELASSMIAGFQQRAANGTMTEAQAKQEALQAVTSMRFGTDGDNYIFVSDTQDRLLSHPRYEPGTAMRDYTNEHGFPIYRRLGEIAAEGGGFVHYTAARLEGGPELPKVTYVDRFAPWGWNVAAGAYLDDIHSVFWHQMLRFALLFGVAALLLAGTLFYFGRRVYRELGGEIDAAGDHVVAVARGDLTGHGEAVDSRGDSLMARIERMRLELSQTVREIRESSESIDLAASEIADGNSDLSERTQQQAASLEQTAASMDELASTVSHTAENTRHARQIAESSGQALDNSQTAINGVVETMSEIRSGADDIAEITSLIDDIAFRTNLLALNASVEAARAGEHGRGFAVVASEVRALAQRSSEAAGQIKQRVDQSLRQAANGSERVDAAQQAMRELVSQVEQSASLVSEISEAASEQSKGIDQVNQAVTQMDSVTQQNAALVEEAAAASQSLRNQAGSLRDLVSRFEINESARAAET